MSWLLFDVVSIFSDVSLFFYLLPPFLSKLSRKAPWHPFLWEPVVGTSDILEFYASVPCGIIGTGTADLGTWSTPGREEATCATHLLLA
jgi:hypothetical protein